MHGAAAKSQHNTVFATWLVKTFGQVELREGEGVVDVAAGLGLISGDLTARYAIRCTCIEPREMRLKPITRKRLRKVYKNRTSMVEDKSPLMQWMKEALQVWLRSCVVLGHVIHNVLLLPIHTSICTSIHTSIHPLYISYTPLIHPSYIGPSFR